jgi:hypothetical protein
MAALKFVLSEPVALAMQWRKLLLGCDHCLVKLARSRNNCGKRATHSEKMQGLEDGK